MFLLIRLFAGFVAAWILWTAGVLRDGANDAIFRIIFGIIPSAIFVGIVWAVGLVLHFTSLARIWSRLGPLVLFPIGVGAGIILFGDQLGLMHTEPDPDSAGVIKVMNTWLLLGAYVFAVFPIVNWPRQRTKKTHAE